MSDKINLESFFSVKIGIDFAKIETRYRGFKLLGSKRKVILLRMNLFWFFVLFSFCNHDYQTVAMCVCENVW